MAFSKRKMLPTDLLSMASADPIDQYTGAEYKITTPADYGTRTAVHVIMYGQIIKKYEHHPVSKCADVAGTSATSKPLACFNDAVCASARLSSTARNRTVLKKANPANEKRLVEIARQFQMTSDTGGQRRNNPA